MGAGTRYWLTRAVSVAVVLGTAALAGAADDADSFSRMRALAARLRRAQTADPGVAPLVASGGFAKTYGGVEADEAFFNKQLGSNYLLTGMSFSFGPFGADKGLPWLLELDGSGAPVLQELWGTAQTEAGVVGFTPDGG